jgi:murein DD-endopeptidase MepM/ murein hydrolase activator NlpD
MRVSDITIKPFLPLPAGEPLTIAWPTPNRFLFDAPDKFFARTRLNPDYGKPGWTRDCGRRFHRGADIAPVNVTPTGQTTPVIFTDCSTGRDFVSAEPTFIPHDEVFCIYPGTVVKANTEELQSDFGRHVIVEHRWPRSGQPFFTFYGHLAEVVVTHHAPLTIHQLIGHMGQTSRDPDARNWMLIAPHVHFEVRTDGDGAYDPVEFLRQFVRRQD